MSATMCSKRNVGWRAMVATHAHVLAVALQPLSTATFVCCTTRHDVLARCRTQRMCCRRSLSCRRQFRVCFVDLVVVCAVVSVKCCFVGSQQHVCKRRGIDAALTSECRSDQTRAMQGGGAEVHARRVRCLFRRDRRRRRRRRRRRHNVSATGTIVESATNSARDAQRQQARQLRKAPPTRSRQRRLVAVRLCCANVCRALLLAAASDTTQQHALLPDTNDGGAAAEFSVETCRRLVEHIAFEVRVAHSRAARGRRAWLCVVAVLCDRFLSRQRFELPTTRDVFRRVFRTDQTVIRFIDIELLPKGKDHLCHKNTSIGLSSTS